MLTRALWTALAVVIACSNALASGSSPVTVNATVVPVCKFTSAAATIAIRNTGASGSNIDPSSATTAQGTANVTYRCTNRTTPVFTVPTTATVTCAACTGAPSMAATITFASGGNGTGFGANRTLTLTGRITQAVFQNARAGAYTGTMTITVTP